MSETSGISKLEQVTQIGAKVLWRPTIKDIQAGFPAQWLRGTVQEVSRHRDLVRSFVGLEYRETREFKLRQARELAVDFHRGNCTAPREGCDCEFLRDY